MVKTPSGATTPFHDFESNIKGGTNYWGQAMGQGIAEIDSAQGKDVLERLLERYVGDTSNPLAQDLLSRSDAKVAIVIRPVNLFTWDFTERMQNSSRTAYLDNDPVPPRLSD